MKRKQKPTAVLAVAVVTAALAWALAGRAARAQDQPDYLSPAEANKVRDAYAPNDRIRLFIGFAGDRLKKLQYELHLTSPQYHRRQILNSLLEAYAHCMDEASDRIDEAEHSGAPIRPAIKDLQKKGKSYLEGLKTIEAANGPELASYRDSLDDAIESTEDALKGAAKASKEYGATPIRRKP